MVTSIYSHGLCPNREGSYQTSVHSPFGLNVQIVVSVVVYHTRVVFGERYDVVPDVPVLLNYAECVFYDVFRQCRLIPGELIELVRIERIREVLSELYGRGVFEQHLYPLVRLRPPPPTYPEMSEILGPGEFLGFCDLLI